MTTVTDEGGYGRFGTLSRVELERFFYLDDEDRRLIGARRRDYNRLKQYTEREKTKLEHAWEIQREYGLIPYTQVELELAAWVADQAWMTGDGPKAMFAGAVE